MKAFTLTLALLVLAACGDLKTRAQFHTPTDTLLSASPGSQLIEVEVRESLPNAFGNADIFGRTRPHSIYAIYFLGQRGEDFVFQSRHVRLVSDATTMNSTAIVIPQRSTTAHRGTVTGTGGVANYSGTSTTSAAPVVIPPSGSSTVTLPPTDTEFALNLQENREISLPDAVIEVVGSADGMLQYYVRKRP